MKKNIILYIAQSVDGFIATEDGAVKWLDKFNTEKYGYEEFEKDTNAIIIGNTTYKQFKEAYTSKPTYVYSNSETGKKENITYTNQSPKELLDSIKEEGNIFLVGGAKVANMFLKENLIDEIRLFTMPIILGKGIRLFSNENNEISLTLVETNKFKSGVVETQYKK